MHASSLENMQRCYDLFVHDRIDSGSVAAMTVLDVGGADVNGSYREIFSAAVFRYVTADLAASDGVDIVLEDPYHLPLPAQSVDIVVSGQMLEHCEFFWLAFQEMLRVTKPDGFIFLIAPSAGPIHRYPVDCYRFYPDAYASLARFAGCHLQMVWLDERGPWRDLVGVFRHQPLPPNPPVSDGPAVSRATLPRVDPPATPASREEEAIGGVVPYLDVLRRVHAELQPRGYLEIGVRHGHSLGLADCPAVAVDPQPHLTQPIRPDVSLWPMTSDEFFREHAKQALLESPDLVFIDGMHLFEFVLRDFMHVERLAAPTTLIAVDDIYPNHSRQAARKRCTRVWTGDVWKLYLCLRDTRPDLFLLPLDTRPTGILLIAALDPYNRVLWDQYNPLVNQYRGQRSEIPPPRILKRNDAVDPAAEGVLSNLCRILRECRKGRPGAGQIRAALEGQLA